MRTWRHVGKTADEDERKSLVLLGARPYMVVASSVAPALR